MVIHNGLGLALLDEGSIRESFFADTFDRQCGCDYAGASPCRLLMDRFSGRISGY